MLSQKQETKWKSFFLLAISKCLLFFALKMKFAVVNSTRLLKQEWNCLKNSKGKRAKRIVFVAKSFPGWPWWHQVGRYSRQTEFVITQITYWKLGGRLFFFQWNRAYVIMIWSLRKSFIKQIQYRYPPSHYCFQILAGKGVSYLLLYHLIR
jgi:hypothetical protein